MHKAPIVLVSSLIAFVATVAMVKDARSDLRELAAIRQAIKDKGAKWTADETPISKMTARARKKLLGLTRKDDELLASLIAEEDRAQELFLKTVPGSFDWRNVEGHNYVTPVKDQKACGACWAFAVTAAVESQYMIATGSSIDLSEQTVVSCSGAGSCAQGGTLYGASSFARDVGIPLESCFPFTATDEPCSHACPNWQQQSYRVNGWLRGQPGTLGPEALKNALVVYGPVATVMDVYTDFFYYRSGIYRHTTGSYEGGHAVLLIGYDDTNQCFIAKNSWGTGWGEGGFFRIAYSEMSGLTKFGSYFYAYQGYAGNEPLELPCDHYLSSYRRKFKAQGGRGSFTVYTDPNCFWTATTAEPWLVITSGASGYGSGVVYYSVLRNIGQPRTGYLVVGDQVYTVTQEGLKKFRRYFSDWTSYGLPVEPIR